MSTEWNGLMPKKLYDWLIKQPAKVKDEIWEWADSYNDAPSQIIEVVGVEDGASNEELQHRS